MHEESASMYKVSTMERNGHRGLWCLGYLLRGKIQKGEEMKKIKEIEKNQELYYMMLGRMECDCKFYLGEGGRDAKYSLYMQSEKAQILRMLYLYNRISLKPVWIDMKTILWYADQMGVRVKGKILLLTKDFILRTYQGILWRKALNYVEKR